MFFLVDTKVFFFIKTHHNIKIGKIKSATAYITHKRSFTSVRGLDFAPETPHTHHGKTFRYVCYAVADVLCVLVFVRLVW